MADNSAAAPGFYSAGVLDLARTNSDFRRVLYTAGRSQLVLMSVEPGEEIGEEVHEDTDQVLTFVSGVGEARVGGDRRKVAQGDLVAVPAGAKHNFVNTGPNPLVLYTVYGPPEHADRVVHHTKEEAEAAEAAGEDEPPTS